MKRYSHLEEYLKTEAYLILSLKHVDIFKFQEGSMG